MSIWTRFMDMHSGGGQKEKWGYIYIEAPEQEAKLVFFNRFGHSPERVTCNCCGDDYFISEEKSLEQATAHERNCHYAYLRPDGSECSQPEAWKSGKGIKPGYTAGYVEKQDSRKTDIRERYSTPPSDKWGLYVSLADYKKSGNVLFIEADQIKASERTGSIPEPEDDGEEY